MGHLLLGDLPRTRRWREVVALVESGSSYDEIAEATLTATRDLFERASSEPGFVESYWLLTQLPLCVGKGNISRELSARGLSVSATPDLLEIITAINRHVERATSKSGTSTDLSELARYSLVEALTSWAATSTGDLFAAASESAGRALRRLGTNKAFTVVSQDFFSRFLNRHLLYFLSRELSNHVGPNRQFGSIEQHAEFNAALQLHCRQATRIVQDFAGGWYSRAKYEGTLTRKDVRGFLHVALGKISKELLREGAVK